MSQIENLIAEHCPDGVQHIEIGKVAELKRGTSITKKSVVEGDISVIAGGRTPAYFHNVSYPINAWKWSGHHYSKVASVQVGLSSRQVQCCAHETKADSSRKLFHYRGRCMW